jgi:cytosine/adenosine deaminase-related metal-dependent hydrolase
MKALATNGIAVTHCPTSNMRLASGISPIKRMLKLGVDVGLGVDGSASNDGGHILGEARQAMLLARLESALDQSGQSASETDSYFSARQALELGTRGGAAALGRKDIGQLELGKCGDFFAINMNKLQYAGALHDPVAAILMCASNNVDVVVVNGNIVVEDGRLLTIDLGPTIERHNKISIGMVA